MSTKRECLASGSKKSDLAIKQTLPPDNRKQEPGNLEKTNKTRVAI